VVQNPPCYSPVLHYPNFTRQFIIATDASDYAIGAVLSQGPVGQDRPIAYASRTLNKAEQNYNTTEKELLAIVWAVKHFRPYVYGTKFLIVTDHKPSVWLFNVNDPGSRLVATQVRRVRLRNNSPCGKGNTNADALNRNPITISKTLHIIEKEKEREYSEEEKRQILREYHDVSLGGHQGVA